MKESRARIEEIDASVKRVVRASAIARTTRRAHGAVGAAWNDSRFGKATRAFTVMFSVLAPPARTVFVVTIALSASLTVVLMNLTLAGTREPYTWVVPVVCAAVAALAFIGGDALVRARRHRS